MREAKLLEIIKLLIRGLITMTIIAFALIIAVVIIISKKINPSAFDRVDGLNKTNNGQPRLWFLTFYLYYIKNIYKCQ